MKPLVSIGMTVYNAGPFLRETLDSLLVQDYPNIELVISDNASTDGSSEICQQYAERDSRIRYFRNDENLGAVKNWNLALSHSQGEYFMWAADHDLWQPEYISHAVEILESDSEVVLVYSRCRMIDAEGKTLEHVDDKLETRGKTQVNRYRHVLWNLKRCHMIHGVMRTGALKTLGGFPNTWAMDIALLGALSVVGSFARLDEEFYLRRENRTGAGQGDGSASREFHLSQLDPAKAEIRQQLSRPSLFRGTRNAQLALLKKTSVSMTTRAKLILMTMHCYWCRHRVGFLGTERLSKLLPRSVRHYILGSCYLLHKPASLSK